LRRRTRWIVWTRYFSGKTRNRKNRGLEDACRSGVRARVRVRARVSARVRVRVRLG
jgi:hypothetical protein